MSHNRGVSGRRSGITDQKKAMSQPIPVQPNTRFTTKIGTRLRFSRINAIAVGRKYRHNPRPQIRKTSMSKTVCRLAEQNNHTGVTMALQAG